MPFTNQELHHLPRVLSAPRFATYLQAAGLVRTDALELYVWNLELTEAFSRPLHLLEVTFRNAVVEGIESIHGGAWPWLNGFQMTLQNPLNPGKYSPRRNLQSCARNHTTVGKVIADLNFAFWERLLLQPQNPIIWETQFYSCFPNAPGGNANRDREHLRRDIETIRRFRNRIAHHEPIFNCNPHAIMRKIVRVMEWRCQTSAGWLQGCETVSATLANQP